MGSKTTLTWERQFTSNTKSRCSGGTNSIEVTWDSCRVAEIDKSLASEGRTPRLYVLCWVELIARRLRRPIEEYRWSQGFFSLSHLSFDLCAAPTMKWPFAAFRLGGKSNQYYLRETDGQTNRDREGRRNEKTDLHPICNTPESSLEENSDERRNKVPDVQSSSDSTSITFSSKKPMLITQCKSKSTTQIPRRVFSLPLREQNLFYSNKNISTVNGELSCSWRYQRLRQHIPTNFPTHNKKFRPSCGYPRPANLYKFIVDAESIDKATS